MGGKEVTITIDGREITAEEGQMLLWVALENDIYIPHLCSDREDTEGPAASCRLCFVEVEGRPAPVPACTIAVTAGLTVKTRSDQIDALVATGFELIMSGHRLECKKCPANGRCELQYIARERKLRLKPRNIPILERNLPVDDSGPGIAYDPGKCVLCGRCVRACRNFGSGVLGFARRGFDRFVTTFGDIPLGESGCTGCGECTKVCPVGAMSLK